MAFQGNEKEIEKTKEQKKIHLKNQNQFAKGRIGWRLYSFLSQLYPFPTGNDALVNILHDFCFLFWFHINVRSFFSLAISHLGLIRLANARLNRQEWGNNGKYLFAKHRLTELFNLFEFKR